MSQIKAILMDIGGVLWHPKEIPLSANWAARCGLSPKESDEIVYNSQWGSQALLGNITGEEMWEKIGNKLGLSSMERSQCKEEYWAGIWDTEFLDDCHTLKTRYKLGIVSDAESTAREKAKTWPIPCCLMVSFSQRKSVYVNPTQKFFSMPWSNQELLHLKLCL